MASGEGLGEGLAESLDAEVVFAKSEGMKDNILLFFPGPSRGSPAAAKAATGPAAATAAATFAAAAGSR